MQNKLEQINITYNPTQDRLLLRANAPDTGEYRLWLTRRYTEIVIKVLTELIDKAGGMQGVASRQDTINQLKGGVFDQEYDGQEGNQPQQGLPLGAAGVLGYRINYAREQSGNTQLQLLPEQGPGMNFSLNHTMLFLMYNLLEQAVAQADWKLHFPQQHRDPVH